MTDADLQHWRERLAKVSGPSCGMRDLQEWFHDSREIAKRMIAEVERLQQLTRIEPLQPLMTPENNAAWQQAENELAAEQCLRQQAEARLAEVDREYQNACKHGEEMANNIIRLEVRIKSLEEQNLSRQKAHAILAQQYENELARVTILSAALEVIHTTVRGDEKSECWTIRKWLDERGIFNDDLSGGQRLVEEVCKAVLSAALARAEVPAKE